MQETLGGPQALSVGASEGSRRQAGPRTGCTYHCPACRSHFTSLDAFDAHRRGKPDARYCDVDAADDQGRPLLVVKSENGSCGLSVPPVGSGAVIYSGRDWWKAARAFGRTA